MEAISQALQPYREIVASVASFVTIAQFFSGGFVCKDIYAKKSTRGKSSMPFIGGVVIGILMLKYGMILNDPAMLQVNLAAIMLNLLYTGFYYQYAEDKYGEVLKPLAFGVGLLAVLLGYTAVESPDKLEFRYGLITTVLLLGLLGAPLMDLKEIIVKKDASSIPFPITFMATIVTFLWLVYGIILQNYFMIVQNVIGYILCVVQLMLIFMYPGGSSPDPSGGQSKKRKSVKRE